MCCGLSASRAPPRLTADRRLPRSLLWDVLTSQLIEGCLILCCGASCAVWGAAPWSLPTMTTKMPQDTAQCPHKANVAQLRHQSRPVSLMPSHHLLSSPHCVVWVDVHPLSHGLRPSSAGWHHVDERSVSQLRRISWNTQVGALPVAQTPQGCFKLFQS